MSTQLTTLAVTATSSIRSWSDGYRAMRARIGQVRGWIELDSDAADRRWPRSTGLDALAIAAFIESELINSEHVLPSSVARSWSACKADLQRDALDAYTETYPNNRVFWRCISTVCASLQADNSPVPSQARWSALIAQLATGRNAQYFYLMYKHEPPLRFLGAMTSFDLYWAQLSHFATLRGSDEKNPEPGTLGLRPRVPRTLNADVIQLADFWTKMLRSPKVTTSDGHAAIAAHWKVETDKIQTLAHGGDPKAVYRENHAFWRQLGIVASHAAPAFPDLDGVQRWRQLDLKDTMTEGVKAAAKMAGDVASGIGRGVQSVAVGVAQGANKTLGALFSGFTTPLLIGGGAVLAFVLLRRGQPQRKA